LLSVIEVSGSILFLNKHSLTLHSPCFNKNPNIKDHKSSARANHSNFTHSVTFIWVDLFMQSEPLFIRNQLDRITLGGFSIPVLERVGWSIYHGFFVGLLGSLLYSQVNHGGGKV
jgi:hypothetical protein